MYVRLVIASDFYRPGHIHQDICGIIVNFNAIMASDGSPDQTFIAQLNETYSKITKGFHNYFRPLIKWALNYIGHKREVKQISIRAKGATEWVIDPG